MHGRGRLIPRRWPGGRERRHAATAKTKLKEALDAAKVPVDVEMSSQAQHGWSVPDMPLQPSGQPNYNKADADRAWAQLLALYKAALA